MGNSGRQFSENLRKVPLGGNAKGDSPRRQVENLSIVTVARPGGRIRGDFREIRPRGWPIKNHNKPTASEKNGGQRGAKTSVICTRQDVSHLHGKRIKGLIAWLWGSVAGHSRCDQPAACSPRRVLQSNGILLALETPRKPEGLRGVFY
jgi:hypothetical protein